MCMWISARLTGNHTCCYEKVKIAIFSHTCDATWMDSIVRTSKTIYTSLCTFMETATFSFHFQYLSLSPSFSLSRDVNSGTFTFYNMLQCCLCADVLVCFMNAEFIVLIRGSIHVRRSCCERNCIQFIYTNARRRRRNMVYSERYTHEKKKNWNGERKVVETSNC